jgi:hypothetical protein
MTTPTVQFSHESEHTVLNRWRALRIAATVIALYLVSMCLLEHDASMVSHLCGIALLITLVQLAHPRLVQQLSVSLRCVTTPAGVTPPDMTAENWAQVVTHVHRVAAHALRWSRGPFAVSRVAMDISPELFTALLQKQPVLIAMEMYIAMPVTPTADDE